MVLSITAYPAYASGMFVVSLAFLTAAVVLDRPEPSRRLLVTYGVLAGFAFWLHPMFLTVMVPMTVVVLWTVRRRLDGWISVIGGGIVGCLPLLLWNATNGWPSLESPVEVPGTYTERLRTFAVDLLPRAFGLRDSGLEWYYSFWGPVLYLALLATIVFGLWTIARRSSARGRVVLFVVLGAVFFLMAFLQNLIYANDGRYAMISFPFVLVALAAGIDRLAGLRPPWRVIGVLTLVAAIWIVGFVVPTSSRSSTPEVSTPTPSSTRSSTCSTSAASTVCTAATGRYSRSTSPATTASSAACSRSGRSASPTVNASSAPPHRRMSP